MARLDAWLDELDAAHGAPLPGAVADAETWMRSVCPAALRAHLGREPVRAASSAGGPRGVIVPRYERTTFEPGRARPEGVVPAELLAPGHPLFEAVLGLTTAQLGSTLRRGTVLVDDADDDDQARVLVLIEHAITDGHPAPGGNRVVSRRFEFVELYPDGRAADGGYAPYLDHRPPTEAEAAAVKDLLDDPWLASGVERAAVRHAVEVAVPTHLAEVRAQVVTRVVKVRAAVRERLTRQAGTPGPPSWPSKRMRVASLA